MTIAGLEWLRGCYLTVSWTACLWSVLKWGFRAGLVAFILHYCWYQFVWKRLTRIPDEAAMPSCPRKRNVIVGEGGELQGELTYREKRERLGRIAQVGEFLEAIELFGYFESGVREILKSTAKEVLVRQGQRITDTGDHHLDIFVLKQGTVKISLVDEEQPLRQQPMSLSVRLPGFVVTSLFNVAVAMLGDDDHDGLEGAAGFQRLSAVAEEDSVCVVIPAAAFKAVKERMPLQARKMVQVIFTRFQRITCSGVLHHLGLLDDLAAIEFAASTNCAGSMPHAMFSSPDENNSGLECMQEINSMECLEDLQRKGVGAILEALRMDASAELLESTDLAHEARVECVLADHPVNNESVYYVSSGVVAVVSPEGEATHYVSTGGCLIVTSVLLGSKCQFRFRAVTSCVLVRLERPSIMKVFERCPGTCSSFVNLLVPAINGFLAFVDLGLNWIHVDAGTPVCFQDATVAACYLVIHGRLRSVRRLPKGSDRVIEVGGGGSFGEVEIMNQSAWPGTVFAVRDSELVRVPRDLFTLLLKARPSVPSTLAKALAVRAPFCATPNGSNAEPMSLFDRTPRQDIKTLAVLPLGTRHLALAEDFCSRLYHRIAATESVAILAKASVLDALGRHAFTAYGKLRLLEWLNGLEDAHRVVIYFAGDSPNSPWTKQCIRQADCIFMVADAKGGDGISDEPGVQADEQELGEYERVLLGLSNRPKIELVLVHPTHHCAPGLARSWLEPRPWVSQHHHVMMRISSSAAMSPPLFHEDTVNNSLWERRRHLHSHYFSHSRPGRPGSHTINHNHHEVESEDRASKEGHRHRHAPPRHEEEGNDEDGEDDGHGVEDIARLSRRVLGTSIGLVLGGGGARGIAHMGVIKAFIEAGIPIDVVGGTSIGALVGGLYCRDANEDTCRALLAFFAARMSSRWRLAYDLTYPYCAWFTGESYNRGMWRILGSRAVEDFWLPFFCVSTDITRSQMRIHREGLSWRCIRASMSLSGFLPPLWDCAEDADDAGGSLLLDGGYVNNLPADVMAREYDHVGTVIAVDVASERTLTDEHVSDEQSGGWLLLRSLLGLRVRVPNLADIQSRLAYVACVESLRRVKEAAEDPESRVKYLRPPVQQFATLEFSQFQAILEAGEAYGREIVAKWRADGTLNRIKGVRDMYAPESHHPQASAPIGIAASPSMGGYVQGEGDDRRKTLYRRRRSL